MSLVSSLRVQVTRVLGIEQLDPNRCHQLKAAGFSAVSHDNSACCFDVQLGCRRQDVFDHLGAQPEPGHAGVGG